MGAADQKGGHHLGLRTFVVTVALIWTAVVASSLAWNISRARKDTMEEARVQARVAYEKDIVYRRWNTMHGGVYVRETEHTRPNPYLTDPNRDVTTDSGLKLTLINPAYMTRQANELVEDKFDVQGHITSRNPLRPLNAPDEWEKRALKAFEEGKREVSSVDLILGREYMRLMRPLFTEAGCLRCHAEQGYRIGDVRGGLSVAVSMEPLRDLERRTLLNLSFAHLFLWVLGLVGHIFGTRELRRSERERAQAERDTRTYSRQLEESNRLKDLFIDIMRHDLLNPAGVIKCYVGYLLEGEKDPRKREMVEIIDRVNSKLTEMIENASKYSRLEEMKSIERSRRELSEILSESVNLVACQQEQERIKTELNVGGEHSAWVNPMIGDVFVNIVSNAFKYAADGRRLEIGILDDGGSWKIYFRDFGPGISDEDKEKIFTRFERLNKEGVKGTGLGLAIASRLVELHGGRIWVEDNPAGGCVFFVTLPKGPPGQAAGEPSSSPFSTITP